MLGKAVGAGPTSVQTMTGGALSRDLVARKLTGVKLNGLLPVC